MEDLLIIGAGPAGLTASIYASCYHLKHLIISANIGGQMATSPDILNYPGFTEITGKELTSRMTEQVKARGGTVIEQPVTKITKLPDGFEVTAQDGKAYQGKAVLLATGTERRKLNIPGEMEYVGKGLMYCAVCERLDYEGKICGVVGGANSAIQAAVSLAQAASKVYLLYRGTELRGDAIWLEQVQQHPKIETLYNTVVTEIVGDGQKMTGIKIKIGEETKELPMDKLFVEIGGVPGTALVAPLGVAMDPGGYIQVNEKMETSMPGIFAAGDMVTHAYSIEQISTAVGLGARACASVFAYLKQGKAPTLWGTSQIKR